MHSLCIVHTYLYTWITKIWIQIKIYIHISTYRDKNLYVYGKLHSLLIKLACRVLLFNLGEQILQTESRQILFGTFEPFQIDMNSNLYKRICLCGQLSLLSGSRGEQHSLQINIEVSFTFSESVILVGHATLIFLGKK